VWQVAQGCPVWRANDGRALAGDGASQPVANTSSAETARTKAKQLRCPKNCLASAAADCPSSDDFRQFV